TLLEEGWMVATSSYRRNGIIIADAIEDLNLLRQHITETHGKPGRVVLMGNSMGGIIGALIAERHGEVYDAVLAAGAAIRLDVKHGPLSLNFDPKIPILFLTNRSEIDGPRDYVERSSQATVPAALWRVDRDGHVNVNDPERLAAIRALEHYLDHGELARHKDGTIAVAANSTARFFENRAEGTIAGVTANHGNIFTSLVPADLEQLGIEPGDHFLLTVGEHTVQVLLGSNYGDVERGEWIGIMRAEGVLMIARNRESACKTLACAMGSTVVISPLPGHAGQ
ncbi:MAG: alpha/beta hydrolase, partial [Gammaproteobacteria bacterium]|nr:alpha/beta hydrolase [Gammaproteobacteria bacterium]